ncbi:MAG TPA: hypothetical protein VFF79_05910 [Conexibacter sp.]|nr:hypothetical protein [Conexibacter sp.]
MTAHGAQLDVDLLAAALRADSADLAQFADVLAGKLQAMLPARTRVERRRAGLVGPKRVRRIVLRLDTVQLELHDAGDGTIEALEASVSGGIVLKHERVELGDWLERLSAALAAEASRSQQTREALERWLL